MPCNQGFKNTAHEPCIHIKTLPDGRPVFFLCQVDDFLMSAPTTDIAENEFSVTQKSLVNPLKLLGTITAFNGMDIDQTQDCIKISCQTHLAKTLKGHNWENPNQFTLTSTPLNSNKRHIAKLETTKGPSDVIEQDTP